MQDITSLFFANKAHEDHVSLYKREHLPEREGARLRARTNIEKERACGRETQREHFLVRSCIQMKAVTGTQIRCTNKQRCNLTETKTCFELLLTAGERYFYLCTNGISGYFQLL